MVKNVICWVLGTLFFLLAYYDINHIGTISPTLGSSDIKWLSTVILEGLIGLTLVVSGTIFSKDQKVVVRSKSSVPKIEH